MHAAAALRSLTCNIRPPGLSADGARSALVSPCDLQAVSDLPTRPLGSSMGDVHRTLQLLDKLCGLLAAPPATPAAACRLVQLAEDLSATALMPSDIPSSSDAQELRR